MTTRPSDQPFLPRYEVLEPLGEGAVAKVYKVRRQHDGQVHALKALKPDRARSNKTISRFNDEFRILRGLNHPSFPHMLDYGIAVDGSRYMVMELVKGEPIDRYLAAHPEYFWLLVYEVTEALAFIHEHELLHLDIKPGNTIVKTIRTADGAVRPIVVLIDFGLSHQRQTGDTAKLIGTPAYMSPEVIRGDERVTRAADYYSLGVMLYEFVEGRTPFAGSVDEILRAHLSSNARIESTRSEFAEIYPWIERLMSKNAVARLEAFQLFRRLVAERAANMTHGLQRDYALGHVESLGMIGKDTAWRHATEWFERAMNSIDSASEKDVVKEITPAAAAKAEADEDGTKRSLEDVMSTTGRAAYVEQPAPGCYLAVSGPPQSGKSYFLREFAGALMPRGVRVVQLDDDEDYNAIAGELSASQPKSVDPQSVIVDRFRDAWRRLETMARQAPVVVVVDALQKLDSERLEFFEYVIRRLELLVSERSFPNVFILVADDDPKLVARLRQLGVSEDRITVIDIPSPSEDDVEQLVASFHGVMSADERRALKTDLLSCLASTGDLILALHEAASSEDLRYERGRWLFRAPAREEPSLRRAGSLYYRRLVQGMSDNAMELLRWLSTHPGELTIDQICDVTGFNGDEIDEVLAEIARHRILRRFDDNDSARLRFVSDGVRSMFYGFLNADERRFYHSCFVDYLSGYHLPGHVVGEQLSQHYQRLNEPRDALKYRMDAIRGARRRNDIFAVRRLCHDGIACVTSQNVALPGGTLLERYFIKTLVNLEWAVGNSGALVQLIDGCYVLRDRPVPLSFVYKYGLSLERAGDIERCRQMVTDARDRIDNHGSETYHMVLLLEAETLHHLSRFRDVIGVANGVDERTLNSVSRATLDMLKMSAYKALGDQEQYEHYYVRARNRAQSGKHHHLLLRVVHTRIAYFFNSGKYEKAKAELRSAIRLASQHHIYRNLVSMYFMASAVYFEEGNYEKAIQYLDKTIRIAVDIGGGERVNFFTLRYAMIFQNLGRLGDALRHAEAVRARSNPEYLSEMYFVTLLMLADLYSTLGSDRADGYLDEAIRLYDGVQSRQARGLFNLTLGFYYSRKREHDRAIIEFTSAQAHYEAVGYEDDRSRAMIAEATTHLEVDNHQQAADIIAKLAPVVAALESEDIRADYETLRLHALIVERGASARLLEQARECGHARGRVRDFNVAVRCDAMLFRAFMILEQHERAAAAFERYYARVKEVCSNLPQPELVESYAHNPEFLDLVEQFKRLQDDRSVG